MRIILGFSGTMLGSLARRNVVFNNIYVLLMWVNVGMGIINIAIFFNTGNTQDLLVGFGNLVCFIVMNIFHEKPRRNEEEL
ncbi:MAG: hypothetical protein ACREBU_02475 [Nitrososphaera sp.]